MAITEIRGNTQIKDVTVKDAQVATDAAIQTTKLQDGGEFIQRDGTVVMTGSLNLGSHKITSVTTPTSGADAANKTYVDSNFMKPVVVVTRDETVNIPDGMRTQFTLTNSPVADSEQVFKNGILMVPGSSDDYTISSDVVTFNQAPETTDTIRVNYIASS